MHFHSLFSYSLSPDEHNDVQKKTFTKWINARFSKVTLVWKCYFILFDSLFRTILVKYALFLLLLNTPSKMPVCSENRQNTVVFVPSISSCT